jgi:uncharacterized protein
MEKKWFVVLSVICFVFVSVAGDAVAQGQSSPAAKLPVRITFASGLATTLAYQYAAAMAKVVSSHSPMTVVVTAMAGPAAYVKQASDTGKPELGWMGAVDIWQAYTGKFVDEPMPDLPKVDPPYPLSKNVRIIAAMPPMKHGFIVRQDSPFKQVSDIRGKRISWGYAGYAPNLASILCYLIVGGLTLKDVVPVDVASLPQGVDALVEGRLDAATSSVGMPATTEADAKIGVRHLIQNVAGPEWLRKGQMIQPGSYVGICPVGEGSSVKAPTPIWFKPNYVFSSTAVPDAVITTFLQVLWDNYKETWPIHATLNTFEPKTFIDEIFPIPVHEAAVKFYKEKKAWTPKMEEQQKYTLTIK